MPGSEPKIYRRTEAVAEVGGTLRVLNLTNTEVHQAIETAPDAKSLCESALAGAYDARP